MAWRYGRKILALYNGREESNSWVFVDGGFGWMKFREDNDDAHTNFTVLAAHAKADNRFVDLDENPVGVISYMYVW
jgi:hypothetical protein